MEKATWFKSNPELPAKPSDTEPMWSCAPEGFTLARHWWLTPVILATQEAQIRRITIRDSISKIPNTKKGLVEWLKW
jgi:hypothetical protein